VPTERRQIAFLLHACRLTDFLEARGGSQQLVTCVALAVRAYQGAGVPLRIRIRPGGRVDLRLLAAGVAEVALDAKRGADSQSEIEVEWERVRFAFARKLAELGEPELEAQLFGRSQGRRSAQEIFTPGLDWATNLVTPRNLEESPDLHRIGRLYP